MLFADSCVVGELPLLAPPSAHSDPVRLAATGFSLIGQLLTSHLCRSSTQTSS